MAVTEVATTVGSALTPGTEAQLLTFTAPAGGGVYQGLVDLANLAGVETLTLYVRARYKSSGAVRVVDVQSFGAGDTLKLAVLLPFPCSGSVEYEIRAVQVGGTGRLFPASIVRIGS